MRLSEARARACEPERRLSDAAPSRVVTADANVLAPGTSPRSAACTFTPRTVDDAVDSWLLGRSSACDASRRVPGRSSKSAASPSAERGVIVRKGLAHRSPSSGTPGTHPQSLPSSEYVPALDS